MHWSASPPRSTSILAGAGGPGGVAGGGWCHGLCAQVTMLTPASGPDALGDMQANRKSPELPAWLLGEPGPPDWLWGSLKQRLCPEGAGSAGRAGWRRE